MGKSNRDVEGLVSAHQVWASLMPWAVHRGVSTPLKVLYSVIFNFFKIDDAVSEYRIQKF